MSSTSTIFAPVFRSPNAVSLQDCLAKELRLREIDTIEQQMRMRSAWLS
jgi:hypothetical protein